MMDAKESTEDQSFPVQSRDQSSTLPKKGPTERNNATTTNSIIDIFKHELEQSTPKDFFDEIDTDNSGFIEQDEFVKAVQRKPHFGKIQDSDIRALFKSIRRADASSKKVSLEEYMSWLAELKLEPAKEYELEWERAEETKKQSSIRIGQYHITGEPRPCRYAFVHKGVLESPNFNVTDIFDALGLQTPSLLFLLNQAFALDDWNVRIPKHKRGLLGQPKDSGAMKHFRGVIAENCKRLLKGTSMACEQAKALIEIVPRMEVEDAVDPLAEWIAANNVNLIGFADIAEYPVKFKDMLLDKRATVKFSPNSNSGDEFVEEDGKQHKILKIDRRKHYNKEMYPPDPHAKSLTEDAMQYGSLPHRQMTHLVLTDKKILLDNVLKAIPRGLICINGGEFACRLFCDAVHNCSPIFLFKYTGGTADLAVEMLEKVDKWLSAKRNDPKARPEQPFRVESIPDHISYNHLGYSQPFDASQMKVAKTLNILIENFPDRYNPSTILRIDMFKTSEERLQDQLTKTMAVVFEGVAELGGQSAETRRLTYAWRLSHMLAYNAKVQKRSADAMNALMIIITMAATSSAVIYTYFEINPLQSKAHANLAASILLKLNLLLPLAATIIRGFNAAMNPLVKWGALTVAKVMVESEIYMYRTKVGNYNARKSTISSADSSRAGNATDKKDKAEEQKRGKNFNPRKVFSEALDAIWVDLAASSISKDALLAPPKSEEPLDEVNDRLMANIRLQRLLLDSLPIPDKKIPKKEKSKDAKSKDAKSKDPSSQNANKDEQAQKPAHFTFMKPKQPTSPIPERRKSALGRMKDDEENENRDIEEGWGDDDPAKGGGQQGCKQLALQSMAPLGELAQYSTSQLKGMENQINPSLRGLMGEGDEAIAKDDDDVDDSRSQVGSQVGTHNDDEHASQGDNKNVGGNSKSKFFVETDDGLTTLTADEYVKMRLIPFIAEFQAKLPFMTRKNSAITFFVISLSVLSSILSTFALSVFIPAALAIGTSVLAWNEYKQTESRVGQTNSALHQLHKLLIWWDGLTMIERRVVAHKEILVQTTEAAIQSQVVNYASMAKLDDEEDE